MSDTIETVKMKLKSATKLKLKRERELCHTRDRERYLHEELTMVKAENDFLREQLEDMKNQITQAKHQISMIEICTASENSKIEAHVRNLACHKQGFQDIFNQERDLFELRMKETQEKVVREQELQRQKEKYIAEINEQKAREAAVIEAECETLVKECAILKKRNNAIMLKLRRKLLETENARRALLKRAEHSDALTENV